MEYRYSLERTSSKYKCPQCGHFRFTYYIDTQTGEYLGDDVGRCDRESSCIYHKTPREHFAEFGYNNNYAIDNDGLDIRINTKTKKKGFDSFRKEDILNTMMPYNFKKNAFVIYLYSLFGTELTNRLIEQFFVGTYKIWGVYSTVFWQIDNNAMIRTGKMMAYSSETGKRIKDDNPYTFTFSWYHAEMKKQKLVDKDFQLEQCLFGLHQLKTEHQDKTIGIVESEKTAILMTVLMPKIIWMSCGNKRQMKKEILLPLFGRKIILFPDSDAFELWTQKAEDLKQMGFDISVNDFINKNLKEEEKKDGFGLADFFIKRDEKFGWALTENKYPLFWDR